MSEFRVSSRYAKSLIDLSVEQNSLDVICSDIKLLLSTIQNNSELSNLLKSPVVKGDQKMAVMTKIFGTTFNKLTMLFVATITRKKREMLLESIAESFVTQYNEIKKIATATVKTAVEANAETIAEIKAFLTQQSGKNVDLKLEIDPSLIGGVMIQMEDRLYDASISGKLRKAKQELLNTYISK